MLLERWQELSQSPAGGERGHWSETEGPAEGPSSETVWSQCCCLGCGEFDLQVSSESPPKDSAPRRKVPGPSLHRERDKPECELHSHHHCMRAGGLVPGGGEVDLARKAHPSCCAPAGSCAHRHDSDPQPWTPQLAVSIDSLSMRFHFISARDSGAFRAHGGSGPSL